MNENERYKERLEFIKLKGEMEMLNYLKDATNISFTENGARSYDTTGSSVLDFFSQSGALRSVPEAQKIALFVGAFYEDPTLALKALFYTRDVRGGLGERDTFRIIARYLADRHTNEMKKNLEFIPEFGRWDDLYAFVGTRLEKDALALIKNQFVTDIHSEKPSVLGKWMKSENASSKETERLGKITRKFLGLSPKEYRKALSDLRSRSNVLERTISKNEWANVEYDKIPSQAGIKYRDAFIRHDGERYMEFIGAVVNGEKSINAGTLYPYEVIRDLFTGGMANGAEGKFNTGTQMLSPDAEDAINALWNNLPDYFDGESDNSLTVVDTSGSMLGLPIQTAISLAIYAAERNKGLFHNHFMTFSEKPQLREIRGTGVCEKVRNMATSDWGSNTNIEAVFDLILRTASAYNLPQEEMVDRVFIISDMQFDGSVERGNDKALFATIKENYESYGYTMPCLTFWTVNSYPGSSPARMTDTGVQLVSGSSASTFTNLLKGKSMTAYDLMLMILNNERYSAISAYM